MSMTALPDVTLIAVDTANHALALRALQRSREQLQFARTLILTDRIPAGVELPGGIDVRTIAPLASRDAYSALMLKALLPHVETSHALIVQWDGYVVNAQAWDPAFLDCDYVGARWFWQPAGFRVGNGGFSLRSRRLLVALQDPRVVLTGAEDLTIGHAFRPLLEREHGIRFADEETAERFAFEAAHPIGRPFGFHGLFNFARVVPAAELETLAASFSPAIAGSPQMAQLIRNAMAAGMWRPAVALAQRRVAVVPDDPVSMALLQQAQAGAASAPVAARNDPCPCGSGKRYKHCHGATGAVATPAASARALVDAALAAHRRGDLDAAERSYRAALALEPDAPLAVHYLGVVAHQRGRPADALPLLERAVALVPGEPEFHNNLGLVLAALDRPADAIAAYRHALALRPAHAVAWSNLGLALTASGQLDDAIDALTRAVALAPDYGEAHWNLGLARLRSGDFARGWPEYEWRLALPAFRVPDSPAGPRWAGEDLAGKTLLVVAEQGLGDTLHFIRFAGTLAARGARVVVAVQDVLARLVATVPGVAAVVARGAPWPAYDAWTPLLSVPGLLGIAAPPADPIVPYVDAPADRRADARRALAIAAPRGPRIGLAWAGSRANTQDHARSCPLAAFAPLLARADATFVSLQKGDGEDEIAAVPAASRLVSLDLRNDFDGTAALVSELDLVLCVDTSIAHLAGALGRPVWILLPHAADWRWLEGRADTNWYPTARLVRQPRPGDWDNVVATVARELDRTLRAT